MAAFDPRTTPTPPGPVAQVGCIWDTGATGTAITQSLVDRLGLIPTGMAKVSTASGESTTSTYLINMVLPNGVGFAGVQATCCVLTPGIEVLVGMDVIGRGDFAISCSGGKTLMSFRTPPSKRIDFVQEHHADARSEATKALIKNRPNAKRKSKKRQ